MPPPKRLQAASATLPNASSTSSDDDEPGIDTSDSLTAWTSRYVNPTCAAKLVAEHITPAIASFLTEAELDGLGISLGTRLVIRSLRPVPQVPTSSSSYSQFPAAPAVAPRTTLPLSLPTFNSDAPSAHTRTFLSQLEVSMLAAEYPPSLYSTALASSITGTGVSWAVSTLPNLSWSEAKESFFAHFDKPNYVETTRARFFSCKVAKGQTITAFADVFLELLLILGKEPDDADALYQFRVALPSAIQRSYLSASIAKPPKTIQEAISLALLLESTEAPPPASTPTPSHQPKFCSLHGSCMHSSKECRTLRAGRSGSLSAPTSSTSSSSEHASISTAAPSSSTATSASSEVRRALICFKCKRPGHYANKCTNLSLLDVTPSQGISFEVILNGQPVVAHLDTGATSSFISPQLCQSLACEVVPVTTNVLLGHRDSTATSSTSSVVTINNTFSHTFLVLDIRYECIIGLDLMAKLGIGITNLPTPATKPSPPVILDAPPSFEEESFFTAEEAATFKLTIQPSLDANAAIPSTSVCSIPDSEVRLPVPPDKAKFVRQYRIPHAYQHLVDRQVDLWKSRGVVVKAPPGCKFNNPLTTAPKKCPHTGRIDPTVRRICLDPRAFNAELPDDHFTLPLIDDILQSLSDAVIFSSLDIEDAYPRLAIHPPDQQVTAFMHRGEHLMFARAIYGIKHMSSHFQRVVTSILQPFHSFCLVFVDDIIVFSRTPAEHVDHLKQVVDCLTNALLPLKLAKCHFGMKKLFLLGHAIAHNQVAIDHRKLINVDEWKQPSSSKEVERFLGFTNYFRKFVPNYPSIAAPLERVRKTFKWTVDQASAWTAFKDVLTCL